MRGDGFGDSAVSRLAQGRIHTVFCRSLGDRNSDGMCHASNCDGNTGTIVVCCRGIRIKDSHEICSAIAAPGSLRTNSIRGPCKLVSLRPPKRFGSSDIF